MYSECEVRQRGVVLIFALLVLLLLSLLTTAVMRGSVLQLRMARNIESTALEKQQALGEIERLLQHLGPGVPAGPRGYLNCTANYDGEACDSYTLPADTAAAESIQGHVLVVDGDRPPPRLAEGDASSALAYRAVQYEVGALSGRTSLAQGVLVLVPELRP